MDSPQLCVFCRTRPVVHAWRPFCSERCKLLDLARWAGGTYRVAAEPIVQDDEPPPADDDTNDGG
ncbi:MAG: DNA gyrase inhibitor YacG [Bacteroidales bacterium]